LQNLIASWRKSNSVSQNKRPASLVVYANAITRTEHDNKTGEDTEREIDTVSNETTDFSLPMRGR
jgi:hypothetical protein